MRAWTVVELRDELNRRITAGQGNLPVTMWVNCFDPLDVTFDIRCGVTSVVEPDAQFPEVQLWGAAT